MAGNFKDTFERKEVKYLLSHAQYEDLRAALEPIAKVDAYGLSSIYNTYFDTPEFSLIRASLEKPVYKEKLRLRCYGIPTDDSTAFVEIKKKYKGIVYKRRISMTYSDAIRYLCYGRDIHQDSQIKREIDYFLVVHPGLIPTMGISYDRIAMAGIEDPSLRLTFDTNLRWSTDDLDLRGGNHGKQLLAPGQVLMEVKIAGAIDPYLAEVFDALKIYPTSFSKYGEGYVQYESAQVTKGMPFIRQVESTLDNAKSHFPITFTPGLAPMSAHSVRYA